MSPVSDQESPGGNAGLRCHILPILSPGGSQTSGVVLIKVPPIPAVPPITGAVINKYVGAKVVVDVVVVLEVVVGLNGAALVVVDVVLVDVVVVVKGKGIKVVVEVVLVDVDVDVITMTFSVI